MLIHRWINIPTIMTADSEAGGRKSRFYVGGAQAGVRISVDHHSRRHSWYRYKCLCLKEIKQY